MYDIQVYSLSPNICGSLYHKDPSLLNLNEYALVSFCAIFFISTTQKIGFRRILQFLIGQAGFINEFFYVPVIVIQIRVLRQDPPQY